MVLHPGHDDLHGITVVLSGVSGRTYVGRWHERGNSGVVMKDVAIHDPARSNLTLEAWLANQRKFGVDATELIHIVPNEEAGKAEVFG